MLKRPNLTINLPVDLTTFAKICKACPKDSVLVTTVDPTQVHVYFDPADAPAKEGMPCDSSSQMSSPR